MKQVESQAHSPDTTIILFQDVRIFDGKSERLSAPSVGLTNFPGSQAPL